MSKSYIESSVYTPPRPLPPRNYVAVSDDKTISSCTPSDDTISTCDLSISSSDVTPPKPPPPLSYTSTLPPPCPSPSPRSKRSRTLPHKKNRMTHSKDIEVMSSMRLVRITSNFSYRQEIYLMHLKMNLQEKIY